MDNRPSLEIILMLKPSTCVSRHDETQGSAISHILDAAAGQRIPSRLEGIDETRMKKLNAEECDQISPERKKGNPMKEHGTPLL
jgi:hypothetical protein